MKDAISEVLETMFFIIVDFEERGNGGENAPLECGIELCADDHRLCIRFKVTEIFARTITANLLGVLDEEVSFQDREDTLKEWANMVGGNFRHRMAGSDWNLGIPYFKGYGGSGEPASEGVSFSSMGERLGSVYLETHVLKDRPLRSSE